MQFLNTPPKDNPYGHQDHFQVMLRYPQIERPHELNLHDIDTRISIANFGSFHQTGIPAKNQLLNVLESNAKYNTISILHAEISQVLQELNDVWSCAAIAKTNTTDSILHETFGARKMHRKVMVGGLLTEDGIPLPKAATSCCSLSPSKR
jgi:hypothetical protein